MRLLTLEARRARVAERADKAIVTVYGCMELD